MRATGVCLLIGTLMVAIPLPLYAAEALAGGRLIIKSGSARYTPADLVGMTEQIPDRIEVRKGWDLAVARIEPDGTFILSADPGVWTLEYFVFGHRAEFVVPHDISLTDSEMACIGTFEISVRDPRTDLGANLRANGLRIIDDCEEIEPRLKSMAGANEVRARPPEMERKRESPWGFGLLDVLIAPRFGVTWVANDSNRSYADSRLVGSFVLPVRRVGSHSNLLLLGEAGSDPGRIYGVAGMGLVFLGMLEGQVGGGLARGRTTGDAAAVIMARGRIGNDLLGIGVQALLGGGQGPEIGVTLDTSPVFLLGACL